MYKAVFLDFYGTLVHEDDLFIEEICDRILASSTVLTSTKEIGRYWWHAFSSRLDLAYGHDFKTQRDIEIASLEDTIAFVQSSENPRELSEILFEHWQTPALFEDTIEFLGAIQVPTVIVSNIDRGDIEAAIQHNNMQLNSIITSEEVRSYKPRADIFQEALIAYNLQPFEVLHIGDSFTNDIIGAHNVGIKAAWINRKNKPHPEHCTPDYIVYSLTELIPMLKTTS
ncbi:2-haloacid dehalogenase/putative hydrolase of the HAD superfamily [Paenibacillus cellulosilyticus]|uniref:2-haloacid dehalogenase/putative hydrolase of the HAD superfamily n=1 Tax=Paenibacillus cellulosilyticus TaxID=375489 RepID=A0A2V2YYY3_9BACL|nr:HAD family hydrolase [Paenibacillus cellulosilyticus]PWW07473.1 2-haloacid dehalogenase/putative hydrolase of the HAD superfamily [Paenibacillus cellulosilyticus]QKS44372.1 HAD family hydrolase [Paenibacillus cellulosilyticus]